MLNAVLGILHQSSAVLIISSTHADKPSSQDMALLGSLAAFADNTDLKLHNLCANDARISLVRSVFSVFCTTGFDRS